VIAGAAAAPVSALADFSGDYTVNPPPNGSYQNAAADGTFGAWTGAWNNRNSVTLNTSGAPSTVAMSMPFNANGLTESYTFLVTAAASGIVSFDFAAVAANGAGPTFVDFVDQTTNSTSPLSGTNSFSTSVNAGDIFGFSLSTVYRGSASLTISNFSAPVPPSGSGVPETGSALSLFALGFVGLLAYRVAAGRRGLASAS